MASQYDLDNDGIIEYIELASMTNPYLAFEELWAQDYSMDQMVQVHSNHYKAYSDAELLGTWYKDDVMTQYFARQGLNSDMMMAHYKDVIQHGSGYERYTMMEGLNKERITAIDKELHPENWSSGEGMFESLGGGVGDILEGTRDIAVGAATLDTDMISEGIDTTLSGAGDALEGGLEIAALPITVAAGTVKVGLEYVGDVISDLFEVDSGGGTGIAEVAPDVSYEPYYGGKENKVGRRETIYSQPDRNWTDALGGVVDGFIRSPDDIGSTRQFINTPRTPKSR